ncbi:type I methionyl aminopeptidase [bacterium]|jgi:methionyl aminopeptidase|nr:type I methionyl aminopeptidase [bacterium]
MTTKVKTPAEIKAMRESGRILATVLQYLRPKVKPGISTAELARFAKAEIIRQGGEPAFLGYEGFPDVICISVNDEIVHGIPKADTIIADGDIVSLDMGVSYKGMITDSAITVIAGRAKQKRHLELVKNTEEALYEGLAVIHDQVRTGDIGEAIEKFLNKFGYGIVRDLVGHGVGHQIHEDPNIPNYGRANTGPWLDAGMTIAVEPMVTLGADHVHIADDKWTVKTADGSWAAHFEHTILITKNGYEILTKV